MFSFWGFGDGLEVTEGVFPDLFKVGAEQSDAFGVELIEAASALLSVVDESGFLEDFEVLRDGGAADGHGGGEFVDGERSGGEFLENGHAS